ncbi:MAG: helix-turn-helix domain-containing protein [Crocinitomicaceae bacterium]|nr:helix-turn-helix domain-containing protein [Crocinitomicaceae bacterium]MCF8434483.1 helix-turn-helix domain-containing protein [Crocinitomicaceae bacterium]
MLIQERLLLVLKMHTLTPSAFADKIGVQRSNVSHVLSGRNKPSLDFLEKILIHFPRVNAHWLITGAIVEGEQDLTTTQLIENQEELNRSALKTEKIEVNQLKEIERIVIFYTDATFKEYSTKSE